MVGRLLVVATAMLVVASCTVVRDPASVTSDLPASATTSVSLPTVTETPRATGTPRQPASPSPSETPESPAATSVSPVIDEEWPEPPERPGLDDAGAPTPPPQVPNARHDFWVADPATGGRRSIEARLRIQGDHVEMWVEEGLWHDIRQLNSAAERVETEFLTRLRAAFDVEWTPGMGGDRRVSVLHATGLGDDVPGYASGLDWYPSQVHPWSNEMELITVNLDVVDVGSPAYEGLLTRGLVHLICQRRDRNEEAWVREGLADLGAALVGVDAEALWEAYLEQTNVSMRSWEDAMAQRGAAFLLMSYVHQRFGDEAIRTLTQEEANGIRGFEAMLSEVDAGVGFDELLAEWLVATYLDSETAADGGEYGYAALDVSRPKALDVAVGRPVTVERSVHQLGAQYIVLQGDEDLQIAFQAEERTPLWGDELGVDEAVWWSNRADESRALLTGRADLRGVEKPVLGYRAWYDIEERYDYAVLELSPDEGRSWHTVRTPSGTDANPYLNSPGWGYTGRSDGWIREEIDLADYAGETLLVRFSYLTDSTMTGEGFVLQEVAVWVSDGGKNDVEKIVGWDAEGFVLTDGWVAQEYLAVLILVGDETKVERLPIGEDGRARWTLPLGDGGVDEAVLVLSAVAPVTLQPARYQLVVSPSSEALEAEASGGQ